MGLSGNFVCYCGTCGTMLRSIDFETGRAERFGHENRCMDCARKAASSPKPPVKRRPTDTTRRTLIPS